MQALDWVRRSFIARNGWEIAELGRNLKEYSREKYINLQAEVRQVDPPKAEVAQRARKLDKTTLLRGKGVVERHPITSPK